MSIKVKIANYPHCDINSWKGVSDRLKGDGIELWEVKFLYLNDNKIKSFEGCPNFPNLDMLNLDGNEITSFEGCPIFSQDIKFVTSTGDDSILAEKYKKYVYTMTHDNWSTNIPTMNFSGLICLEGLMGVGKTTLGRNLFNYMSELNKNEVVFHAEPFDQKMLEQFLGNPKKYAYAFQLYMLARRKTNYVIAKDLLHKRVCSIIERSLTGDLVFAKLQHKNENISDSEMEVYQSVYDEFAPYKPDHVIYLDVPVSVAMGRIRKRHRTGEDTYTEEYLTNLKNMYETVIREEFPDGCGVQVHWIDWSEDIKLDTSGSLPVSVCQQIVDRLN